MSAAGRGAARRTSDEYLTADDTALACVNLLPIRPGQRVLEPSAGEASFLRALWYAHGVLAEANEIRTECRDHLLLPSRYTPEVRAYAERIGVTVGADFPGVPAASLTFGRFQHLRSHPLEAHRFDWIVGNPPYLEAEDFVRHAMYLLKPGGHVAYLLRLNFCGADERTELFRLFPLLRNFTLQQRPSFTGTGTDACEYAFLVWKRTSRGLVLDCVQRWVAWKKPELYVKDRAIIVERDWPALAA